MQFEGIYTPVITPFDDHGAIQYDAFAEQICHLVESGVQGLMVGGTTSEYYVESHEERLELLRLASEVKSPAQTLVFGTGHMDPRASVRLAEAAADNGADAVLIATPPYSLPTQRELAQHILTVDRAAGLPAMLYNYPDRMGVTMDEECLDRVGRSPTVCGIKESSGDINRVHLLARDYPHIQMACGMDDQALEFFAWGARSWVCAGSNFLAKEHLALYRACVLEGNFDKGRRIMSALMPLMRVLEQGGKFIQCVKYGVTLDGRFGGEMRAPLRGLNKDDQRAMRRVVDTLKTTIARIESETAGKTTHARVEPDLALEQGA